MGLQTMTPATDWDPTAHQQAVETLAGSGHDLTFKIWGDDGCGDCQRELPPFAAALAAAGIDQTNIEQFAVERLPEGKKKGQQVEEYGIELIPTIVVERDGEELFRFVETADQPAADYIADRLRELEATT